MSPAVIEDFHRIKRLPPYVFAEVNRLKAAARARGADIVDLGMGNPDLPTPQHIIDKLVETVAKLKTWGWVDALKLMHFHLGSQQAPSAVVRHDPIDSLPAFAVRHMHHAAKQPAIRARAEDGRTEDVVEVCIRP